MITPSTTELTPRDLAYAQEKALIRIVDDDSSFRDALECVLSMEGWQVQGYSGGLEFLAGDQPSLPGVVIMDLRMPVLSGLETQAKMRERRYDIPIVFLTGYGEVDTAVWALTHGAVDFVQKPVNNERLLRTVAGYAFRSVSKSEGRCSPEEAVERLATLTTREMEIAVCLTKAMTNRQIAANLQIAQRTVEVHRRSVLTKLGLSRAEDVERLFQDADYDGLTED